MMNPEKRAVQIARLAGVLVAVCMAGLGSAPVAAHAGPTETPAAQIATTPIVTAVDSVGVTVADLDRSVEFYTSVLAFERVSEREEFGDAHEHLLALFGVRTRTARLRLGSEFIELTEFLAPQGRQIPADSRSNDRWFQHIAIVVSDIDAAYKRLREHHVRHASSGPQTLPQWNPHAGGISAFYFKDPDAHVLEIIHFPDGKGDPKWRTKRSPNDLFLGIDHTAIVVGDTDESLKFYRDTLGMRVAGESENSGTEQEHLNNIFGARLRITALRAEAGPGVELLEYLAPTNGRPYPADSSANDLWHWHTVFATHDIAGADRTISQSAVRYQRVSAGVVRSEGAGTMDADLITDPDGHAAMLIPATTLVSPSVRETKQN